MKNQLSILILTAFFSAAAFSATPVVRYGDLPLSFEENHGQTNGQVKFLAHGHGYTLFLTGREAVLAAPKAAAIHMNFLGANPTPRVSGTDELPGKSNYFIGSDPAKWHSNVPTFAKVKYESIYPGVDLIYYGNQRQLEYDFVLAPGADPRRIQFHIRGAKKISLSADGDLVLRTNGGDIRWHKPAVYQEMDGVRREIAGRYDIQGGNRVGFEVADYDRGKRLIVDPVLSYSTYLGGSAADVGEGIAVDKFGSAYVSGTTSSVNFPVSKGTPSSTYGAFVAKFDPSGSRLVYSTYIGGSGGAGARAIAIDSLGDAYVTGYAGADFPTVKQLQKPYGGKFDAFVLELDHSGSTLVYSTYLGGKGWDEGMGIAVDSLGAAYVTGSTGSRTFPLMNPMRSGYSARFGDAFVAKINPLGAGLAYSTYFGAGKEVTGNAIAVDSLGDAYITGSTTAPDFYAFPTTPHSFQPRPAGPNPAFVAELNPSGSNLIYCTFLGGEESGDAGYAIAVDSYGDAYVTGVAASKNFPTVNPVQKNLRGARNSFVTEFDPSGSALIFSTYLGGNSYSQGAGIALDSSGNVYVVGSTESTSNFPLLNPLQSFYAGNVDGFVAELSASGSELIYSSYLGGSLQDYPNAIAVDSSGNAYITGQTSSADFPTHKPFQAIYGGGNSDAFVAKLATPPGQAPTTTALTSSLNPSAFGQTVDFTAKVRSEGNIPPDGETVTFRQGATVLASVELAGGAASFSTSTMSVGKEGITATFSGTASLASSVSPTVELVINKATTKTTLTSAQNPSTAGTTVVLTAKVSAQYSGTPHGSVVFKAGTQPLATVTLIDGVAEYATSELAKGSYSITATYEGNANFETSTTSLTQTVQ